MGGRIAAGTDNHAGVNGNMGRLLNRRPAAEFGPAAFADDGAGRFAPRRKADRFRRGMTMKRT